MATACIAAMTGCSDEKMAPSAVDEKQWSFDKNNDLSYAPGDNFFMYCNGKWWNETELGDLQRRGLIIDEAEKIVNERIQNLKDPRLRKLENETAHFEDGYESADRIIKARLQEYEGLTMIEATARFLAQGYDTNFTLSPFPHNGKMCVTIGIAGEESEQQLNAIVPRIGKKNTSIGKRIIEHPEERERMVQLKTLNTKSGKGETFLSELMSELGFDENDVYVNPETAYYINNVIAETWATEYKDYIAQAIEMDYCYVSQEMLDRINEFQETNYTIEDLVETAKEDYMPYLLSYLYTSQYISPELKEEYTRICEEMRDAFRQRIERLDWMSSTTKTYALNKLDKMKFCVGYPDKWIEEGLAPLDGESLTEDIMQLREARFRLIKEITGKNAQDTSMDFYILYSLPLTETNSSYLIITNTMNLYPNFMLPPFYDKQVSDAFCYAVFGVIGHEMTHGFDSNGANYDEKGDMKSWWTVADKMEFEERQMKLANCYNKLEVLPDEMPGYYCPGLQTLTENIADLGGIQIAYEAYTNRLKREGYYGESFEQQERRFLQGWAELWRIKYGAEWVKYAFIEKQDVHSMAKERVNGVMMNIDRWYELYNVTPENILYLPKERRTYLW